MTAPTPVDFVVNPNNKAQQYVVWGNGRVDAYGGALPVLDGPRFYDRTDQPIVIAMYVSNWATPSGYMLDIQGGFQAFGGAPAITSASGDTFVNNNGLPYVLERRYCAWSWNPNGSGMGYAVDIYGQLFPFGGAPAPSRSGPRFTVPAVKGFEMLWSGNLPGKAYMVDASGAVWQDWSAVAANPPGPYFPNQDVVRDLVVTDWTNGRGYVLTGDGATHPFGGAASPLYGGPYRKGQDVARQMVVLSASNPTKLAQVHSTGGVWTYVASSPPTVVPNSPATTVTDTTRPNLSWSYTDPQQDSQAGWELYLFPQSFVTGHDMSDPSKWASSAIIYESGNNPSTRGVALAFDLANGSYRFYVRALDTADQWSAWANRGWTQNIAVPPTPTGVSATPSGWNVNLSAVTGGSAPYVRFECTDDSGLTWKPVRGAELVPRSATTTAVDRDAPLAGRRGYRTVTFGIAPRTASVPSAAVYVDTYQVPVGGAVLTSTADPALGGEVLVIEAPSWTQEAEAEVFETLNEGVQSDSFPTVVSYGRPRSRRGTLSLECDRREEWEKVQGLLRSDSVLVLRDTFGDVMYVRVVGSFSKTQQRLAPYADEFSPLRHNHRVPLPLVEVAQPVPAVS